MSKNHVKYLYLAINVLSFEQLGFELKHAKMMLNAYVINKGSGQSTYLVPEKSTGIK